MRSSSTAASVPCSPPIAPKEIKAIGDALMLRCDDPGAAVRLGLEIVDMLESVDGFPPVGVGIYSGPAVARG